MELLWQTLANKEAAQTCCMSKCLNCNEHSIFGRDPPSMCPNDGLTERLSIHISGIISSQPVTFASSAVRDGFGHVPVVTLLAVVTVASCRVVATVETDSTTPAT